MLFQRSAVRALLRQSARRSSLSSSRSFLFRSLSSETATTAPPQQFASKTEQWQHEGILDERGLVNFDTLHNMQVRSCRVFADKNLFATYSEVTQKFEWMTFAECTCCGFCVGWLSYYWRLSWLNHCFVFLVTFLRRHQGGSMSCRLARSGH